MTDRKLRIEDIAEPAKERIKFVVDSIQSAGFLNPLPSHASLVLRHSDLWTSQNPIEPTLDELSDFIGHHMDHHKDIVSSRGALAQMLGRWQRRVYLKPKPELPEGVKAIFEDYVGGSGEAGRGMLTLGALEEMVGKIVMLMQKEGK